MIASIMNVSVDIQLDESRLRPVKSEVERLWADNTKARTLLNWSPSYAGLDGLRTGLSKTIDWFQNPTNLACYKSQIYNI